MATSEAQKWANKKYREKNKEKEKIGSYRRTARLFIKTYATIEELEEFKELINEREAQLNSEQK